MRPSTLKVVHPFETLFPASASTFPLKFPARELFHRPFDVEFLAHSGVVDVLLEARNLAWAALGTHLADVLMQTDMAMTRMVCDQPDQIRSLLHAKYLGICRCENLVQGP
jgi:hypothetical protein